MSPNERRQVGAIAPANERSRQLTLAILALSAVLSGCAGQPSVDLSAGHVLDEQPESPEPPPIVTEAPVVPEPAPAAPIETYTVVVKEVPVTDLLFSLARDAELELDLQSSGGRTVTLNAVDRPLPEILQRIAVQAGLRYTLAGNNLVVQDDVPYWQNYPIDYVNVTRDSMGEVGVATQIAATGGSVDEDSNQQGGDEQGNLSKTTVRNTSNNDFWQALEEGLTSVVMVSRDASAETMPEAMDPVIVNSMSGIATVFGNQETQRRVQQYLDETMSNSQRQVLIEMTIVEVLLSDNYQAGVDWQRLSADAGAGSNGVSFTTDLIGANLSTSPFVALGYNSVNDDGSSITATVRLLQQFGDTQVLSSPKIMALNNQTAILKVVDERVYFTIELDIREATRDIPERRTFTSEIHTVPIGLVMSVTPQISNHGQVSLNIRPTISRITGFAVDPAPRLAGAEFDNLIPEIQVREIESLLQIIDGQTVVLGGLMQNEQQSSKDGVPGLSKIPGVGKLFSYSTDKLVKTELVIFLRPTIVSNGTSPPGTPGVSDYLGNIERQPAAKIEYR